MSLTNRDTAASKPNAATVQKYRPLTFPTSTGRVLPASKTSATCAASQLIPRAEAKSLQRPAGANPRMLSSPGSLATALTTS